MQSVNMIIVCLLLTVISISVFFSVQTIYAQTIEVRNLSSTPTSTPTPVPEEDTMTTFEEESSGQPPSSTLPEATTPTPTPTPTATQWKVYTNNKFGFSTEYPQSWIISEKQSRFESGVDLTIESPDILASDSGRFTFVGPIPAPTSNVRILTNLGIKETLGGFDVDYDKRLIDDANVTKYKIDGDIAGTFTYVLDRKDLDDTTPTPFVASEVVLTVHNGNVYNFQFIASTDNFDNPTLTDIRQHMFNSIKWLN